MLKIFHNPRCRKSREGLEYLKSKTTDIDTIEYLKTGLTIAQLQVIISKSGLNVMDLIRKQEEVYKKELKGKDLSDEDLLKAIADNPKLLQRPIIISDNKAVLGQPVENIDTLL